MKVGGGRKVEREEGREDGKCGGKGEKLRGKGQAAKRGGVRGETHHGEDERGERRPPDRRLHNVRTLADEETLHDRVHHVHEATSARSSRRSRPRFKARVIVRKLD